VPPASYCAIWNGAGFFHQAHRAVDCHALLEILALELPTTSTPALAALLEQARKETDEGSHC
jgi:DNA polymerase-3 subunit epsilon